MLKLLCIVMSPGLAVARRGAGCQGVVRVVFCVWRMVRLAGKAPRAVDASRRVCIVGAGSSDPLKATAFLRRGRRKKQVPHAFALCAKGLRMTTNDNDNGTTEAKRNSSAAARHSVEAPVGMTTKGNGNGNGMTARGQVTRADRSRESRRERRDPQKA